MLESENQEEIEEAEAEGESSPDLAGEGSAKGGSSRLDAAKAFFRALNAGSEEDAESASKCASCEQLRQKLAEAEQKAGEAEGHYKRMAADFENFRRRIEREREEFQQMGVKKALESLLPALDDLDRAQSSLTLETPADRLLEGLSVVSNSIKRALDQIGLKALSVIGEPFDPRLHEPVQNIETNEVADGAVVHELRRGYMLNDKVLRPALVNVASNKGQAETEIPTYEIDEALGEEAGADAEAEKGQEKEEAASESAVLPEAVSSEAVSSEEDLPEEDQSGGPGQTLESFS